MIYSYLHSKFRVQPHFHLAIIFYCITEGLLRCRKINDIERCESKHLTPFIKEKQGETYVGMQNTISVFYMQFNMSQM